MLKILETHEIAGILAIFLIVQFAGLLIAVLTLQASAQATIIDRLVSGSSMALSYGVDIVLALIILMLLLNRHKRHNRELWNHRYFAVFEAVVLTATSFFAFLFLFTAVLPEELQGFYFVAALAAALLVVFMRERTDAAKNLATIVSSVGVGLILGFYFSFAYALLILAIVAVYDYIAVFVTKSMIKLANTFSKENVAFLVSEQDVEAIPPDNVSIGEIAGYTRQLRKSHADRDPLFRRILESGEIPVISQIQLGEGDLGLPLMAIASAYFTFSIPFMAIVLACGAAIGLIVTVGFLKRFKTPLPAIPPLFASVSVAAAWPLWQFKVITAGGAAALALIGAFVIVVGMGATLIVRKRKEKHGDGPKMQDKRTHGAAARS